MGTRRKARELAMKALFCMDMLKNESDELLERLEVRLKPPQDIQAFYVSLIKGVIVNKPQIDQTIETYSSNWKISRMGYVDRNILRIATYELLFCPDIPPKVTINEAVDIGKLYGTEDSGAFINGILDVIYRKNAGVQKNNHSD
jgi:N utilization substance protein B